MNDLTSLKASVADLLTRAFGPAASEMGSALGEQLASYRARNLDRLYRYWLDRKEAGTASDAALAALPFGEKFRIIEAASLTEDEDITRLWSDLLAAEIAPDEASIYSSFIETVKGLSSIHVHLVDYLWLNYRMRSISINDAQNLPLLKFRESVYERVKSYSSELRLAAVSHLVASGLIRIAKKRDFDLSLSSRLRELKSEMISVSRDKERKIVEFLDDFVRGNDPPSESGDIYDKELTPYGIKLLGTCRPLTDTTEKP